jgi:hypothetical protein
VATWDDVRRLALALPETGRSSAPASSLEEVTTEAWLARAPAKLARAYLNDH